MPVALASELWSELKRYVNSVDKDEAAETVVNILIDNDIDIEEIKSNFKGDPEIKRALSQYTEDLAEDPDEDLDEDYEEEY
jgi:hypothetical protein